MKIVHIVFEGDGPISTGARLRNDAIYTALSQIHDTNTLAIQDFLGLGSRFLPRGPAYISVMFTRTQLEKIITYVQANSPDLVVVDGVYFARIAEALHRAGLRVIIVSHNVESALMRRVDEAETPAALLPVMRRLNRKRWQRAEAAERQLGAISEAIWVCSEQDARDLAALVGPDTRIEIVPNPVPKWCEQQAPRPERLFSDGRAQGLFIGHLNYKPNIIAAQNLANHIVPAIQTALPEFTLTVAGFAPGKALTRILNRAKGVKLIASPPELRGLYEAADVAVIPLTVGGGTRIKALEAMACGVPVVASEKAVEGLGLRDKHEFLLAETPEAYGEAIATLAHNADLRQQLVQAAHDFVASRHTQPALNALIEKILPQ